MLMLRQTRIERSLEPRRIRFQERDQSVLVALWKMRFARTMQLARLEFHDSREAATKRLRKLHDAGLIKVWMTGLAEENIYSLAPAGVRLLEDIGRGEAQISAPRRLTGNLRHLHAVNQVRISLALSLDKCGGEIQSWRSDWELERGGRGRLLPDAIFTVEWDEGEESSYALEVDNGTRAPRAFIRKAERYAAREAAQTPLWGLKEFSVLVVGTDGKWLTRYRRSLAGRTDCPLYFAELQDVVREGAKGQVWRPAWTEESYSLREAVFPPYRGEGVGAVTA